MRRICRLILASLAVLVVGCGASNQAASNASQLKLIDAVSATNSADTAHASLNIASHGTSSASDLQITSDGAFDFSNQKGEQTATVTAPQFTSPLNVNSVEDGGDIYLKLPSQLVALTGTTQPWVKVDAQQALSQSTGLDFNSLLSTQGMPSNALTMLDAATKDTTVVGNETVRGAQTKHYRSTLDFQQAAANETDPAKKEALTRFGEYYNNQPVPVDVWIDNSNRVRKVSFSVDTAKLNVPTSSTTSASQARKVDVTLELYDFGTPVNVAVPPADQVRDITGLTTRSPT